MQAITAGRLFDGEQLREPATVTIDGEHIVAAGEPAPADADLVDLGDDVTLLPGLVDTHQHLCFNQVGTLEEQVAERSDDELRARARGAAVTALRGGVTTLRDLGDRNFVTLALRGDPELPTILAAGPPLTPVRGHCWYLGGECTGVDELRAAVRERADRGCDAVKIMVSGGMLTPTFPMWESQFSVDELRAVVDEAHAHGLPVAAHCHAIDSIRMALDVGVDSIEHCTFFTPDDRSDPPADLLQALATSGITISLTIGSEPGLPAPPRVQENLGTILAALGHVHACGGSLVLGTDGGIAPPKPHDVARHALVHLDQAGVPLLDGLRIMTAGGAASLGLGGSKGNLAPGFDADILAVRGNPTIEPTALANTEAVWLRGTRVV